LKSKRNASDGRGLCPNRTDAVRPRTPTDKLCVSRGDQPEVADRRSHAPIAQSSKVNDLWRLKDERVIQDIQLVTAEAVWIRLVVHDLVDDDAVEPDPVAEVNRS